MPEICILRLTLVRRVFGCLCVLLMACSAFALDPSRSLTQYVHRIWQEGLPQGTIYSILQTQDGYLWLGMQTGLVRFDGVRFTSPNELRPNELLPDETRTTGPENELAPLSVERDVQSAQGAARTPTPANELAPRSVVRDVLKSVWVRALAEDGHHNLWIGTNDAGLFRLHGGAVTQYSVRQGLPSDTVHCLVQDRQGALWVCTLDGLAQIASGRIQVYRIGQGLSTNNVRAACEAADGTIWAGGDSAQLSVWNGSRFVSHKLASIAGYTSVRSMLCAHDGSIWVGTTNGLIHLKGGHERLYTVRDGLPDNWILCLQQANDGGIWIGTKDGFSRWHNGEIESFRSKDGLSQSSAYSAYEDREGSLWIGTKHGLNQFLDGRAIPYTMNEGLPSNDTGPVLQDSSGIIWVGTLDAGLGRFDGRRFTAVTTKNGLASDSIYALATDRAGDLWVGTNAGLNRLRNGHVAATYRISAGLPSNAIRCLFLDRSGVLWIGTAAGLTTFRDGAFVQPPGLRGVLSGPILAIAQDAQNRIFAATESGDVHVYANGKLTQFSQNGLPPRDIVSFYKDRDGLLWMGTLGASLRLLKDGKVFNFYMHDGLFDDEIYGIAGDDQDRLWMACSKGIFSVSRSDLLNFAAGKIKQFDSAPYIPTDALRTIECKSGVQPAVARMQDGRLWFSTIRGLIALDPKHFGGKLQPPQVVIEDVTVNGESATAKQISKLAPGRKNLEFRYTGLSFVLPTHITFRYILEGFDKNWIDAGTRREAFYTNLPPGKFRFRVQACNVDGTCNEAGSSIAFTLAPHYYQEPWFIPLCIALAGFGAWLMYQSRVRRLRDQFSLILNERSRIARELHDTLIQGFSGITMEMQALSARLRSQQERSTLQEIIQDAGNCLREARRSVTGLRSAQGPNSGLTAAIAEAARHITEAKDVRLKLKLESGPLGLAPDVEYNLLRIAQEAVSNSVKHSGARSIEVALNQTPEVLRLSVKDDGSGFAGEDNGYTQLGHYGLIGMKERASHIGADFRLASEPGRGTTVSVLLPTRKTGNGHAPADAK